MLHDIRRAFLTILAAIAIAAPARAQSCVGDLNADRNVSGADLGILLGEWGSSGGETGADLNGDGSVTGSDLGLMLGMWGDCPVSVPSWATLVEAAPDPAVVTDRALRAAIAATGLAWRVRHTATQVEMLLVPPGTFQMGCTMGVEQYPCSGRELPVHQVTLTNAYYLGRYELTQSQWVATMGSNPSYFVFQGQSRPVEQVSWNTIQGYLSATGFRLPTEAEWEYACRAGTQTPYYDGSTYGGPVGTLAWFSANSCTGGTYCGTRPVGGKLANAFGFHDMLGNVSEWVNDWYATYPSSAQTNPTGPVSASYRVFRGGSCAAGSERVLSWSRDNESPGAAYGIIGFRVARNP